MLRKLCLVLNIGIRTESSEVIVAIMEATGVGKYTHPVDNTWLPYNLFYKWTKLTPKCINELDS